MMIEDVAQISIDKYCESPCKKKINADQIIEMIKDKDTNYPIGCPFCGFKQDFNIKIQIGQDKGFYQTDESEMIQHRKDEVKLHSPNVLKESYVDSLYRQVLGIRQHKDEKIGQIPFDLMIL